MDFFLKFAGLGDIMNRILKNIVYHAPWLLSDRRFLELDWKLRYGREIDLDNPETFNEKIQWLKLNDRREDYFSMADKVEAKHYAAGIIGAEHVIPTIGVYDTVKHIDWDSLPSQFVLKCTHDSGGLVICRDKDALDRDAVSRKLRKCLGRKFHRIAGEWCYRGIRPRILCEPLMQDELQRSGLTDYKFFCFSGKPEFLYISTGLEDHGTACISFVDMQGRRMPFRRSDYAEVPDPLPIPVGFEEMKAIAARLAEAVGNRFIRVDLYEIDGTVYFSELTFYPNGGHLPFDPPEWDRKLGDLIGSL